MTQRQKGVDSWRRGIEGILAGELAQGAEVVNAEMVRRTEGQEAEKEEAEQAARMAPARRAEREQEANMSRHLDMELLKRPLRVWLEIMGVDYHLPGIPQPQVLRTT